MKKFVVFAACLVIALSGEAEAGLLAAHAQSQSRSISDIVQVRVVARERTVVRHGGPVHGPTVRRTVVVRPYKPWVRRPYYGAVVAGVAVGTVIAVATATPPPAPSPELCWYWSNSAQTRGYWDYCTPR